MTLQDLETTRANVTTQYQQFLAQAHPMGDTMKFCGGIEFMAVLRFVESLIAKEKGLAPGSPTQRFFGPMGPQ